MKPKKKKTTRKIKINKFKVVIGKKWENKKNPKANCEWKTLEKTRKEKKQRKHQIRDMGGKTASYKGAYWAGLCRFLVGEHALLLAAGDIHHLRTRKVNYIPRYWAGLKVGHMVHNPCSFFFLLFPLFFFCITVFWMFRLFCYLFATVLVFLWAGTSTTWSFLEAYEHVSSRVWAICFIETWTFFLKSLNSLLKHVTDNVLLDYVNNLNEEDVHFYNFAIVSIFADFNKFCTHY